MYHILSRDSSRVPWQHDCAQSKSRKQPDHIADNDDDGWTKKKQKQTSVTTKWPTMCKCCRSILVIRKSQVHTVKTRFTDTRLIQLIITSSCFVLGEGKPSHFFPNSTHLIRILSMFPSVSVLTWFNFNSLRPTVEFNLDMPNRLKTIRFKHFPCFTIFLL